MLSQQKCTGRSPFSGSAVLLQVQLLVIRTSYSSLESPGIVPGMWPFMTSPLCSVLIVTRTTITVTHTSSNSSTYIVVHTLCNTHTSIQCLLFKTKQQTMCCITRAISTPSSPVLSAPDVPLSHSSRQKLAENLHTCTCHLRILPHHLHNLDHLAYHPPKVSKCDETCAVVLCVNLRGRQVGSR